VTDEVTVAVVPRFEAEMLCEALRGEGIKCGYRITDFGAGMSDGFGGPGAPHAIIVAPEDAERARQILEEEPT